MLFEGDFNMVFSEEIFFVEFEFLSIEVFIDVFE